VVSVFVFLFFCFCFPLQSLQQLNLPLGAGGAPMRGAPGPWGLWGGTPTTRTSPCGPLTTSQGNALRNPSPHWAPRDHPRYTPMG